MGSKMEQKKTFSKGVLFDRFNFGTEKSLLIRELKQGRRQQKRF